MDGANVEMYEQVGEDNIYIFGLRSDEVDARVRVMGNDEVKQIYATNASLRGALEMLINGSLAQDTNLFMDLYNTLVFGDYGQADTYMVLRDFEDYMRTHEQISKDYLDRKSFIAKQIMNTAMAGFFSSDRTINEYNDKIWHLTPIK
jgi:starch phosphorylase